jgi:diguanylate cyclase (GGDEF)-like protein
VAERPFDTGDFELLGALADQAAVAIENARLFKQVDTLSKTDPLTGLSNRRQLELDLAREFAAARRGRSLFAAMFDVNDFKEYNDRYGHVAGDEVLRLFGEVIRTETRAMNPSPARYGGDEFVVLITDTDACGAQVFTERVRLHFSQAVARLRRRTLSVSAGFALCTPDMAGPDDLIDAADRALYASKANKPRAG